MFLKLCNFLSLVDAVSVVVHLIKIFSSCPRVKVWGRGYIDGIKLISYGH